MDFIIDRAMMQAQALREHAKACSEEEKPTPRS